MLEMPQLHNTYSTYLFKGRDTGAFRHFSMLIAARIRKLRSLRHQITSLFENDNLSRSRPQTSSLNPITTTDLERTGQRHKSVCTKGPNSPVCMPSNFVRRNHSPPLIPTAEVVLDHSIPVVGPPLLESLLAVHIPGSSLTITKPVQDAVTVHPHTLHVLFQQGFRSLRATSTLPTHFCHSGGAKPDTGLMFM